jgi:large subunit ribosomal protein L2
MGKRIISQARGKGGPTYKAPSFKYKGSAKHRSFTVEEIKGQVVDIIKCPAHSAPLAIIEYEDQELNLMIAPEGLRVGDIINTGGIKDFSNGSCAFLKDVPEGTMVYNLELKPGDGGKLCRAAGAFAKVVSKINNEVVVILPSKKKKIFHINCRANIGVIAGGGFKDKPLTKAGNSFYKMKAKNKLYPKVSGGAMNAVDHPFGNARSSRKSNAKVVSRHAPPGRKVGMVAARRTGRKKK